jgi:hypothetical protein
MTLRSLILSVSLAFASGAAMADGTLTHLSGAVSVQKADGSTATGNVGTRILTGDTVVTGARSYVRMEMTDGGEMVLRPDSQMKLENYAFNPDRGGDDNMVLRMLKGGFRTVTGLIGKRGNRDAYQLRTSTATIGIRGTQFDLRVCEGNCGALPNGTYVAVRFGAVEASSPQGSIPVAAGQVARVPGAGVPAILPRDPGIGFSPPAVIPRLDERRRQQQQQQQQTAPAGSTTGVQGPGGTGGAQGAGQSGQGGSSGGGTGTGSGQGGGSGSGSGTGGSTGGGTGTGGTGGSGGGTGGSGAGAGGGGSGAGASLLNTLQSNPFSTSGPNNLRLPGSTESSSGTGGMICEVQ